MGTMRGIADFEEALRRAEELAAQRRKPVRVYQQDRKAGTVWHLQPEGDAKPGGRIIWVVEPEDEKE